MDVVIWEWANVEWDGLVKTTELKASLRVLTRMPSSK